MQTCSTQRTTATTEPLVMTAYTRTGYMCFKYNAEHRKRPWWIVDEKVCKVKYNDRDVFEIDARWWSCATFEKS